MTSNEIYEYRKAAAEKYKMQNPNYKTEQEKQIERDEEMAKQLQIEEQKELEKKKNKKKLMKELRG